MSLASSLASPLAPSAPVRRGRASPPPPAPARAASQRLDIAPARQIFNAVPPPELFPALARTRPRTAAPSPSTHLALSTRARRGLACPRPPAPAKVASRRQDIVQAQLTYSAAPTPAPHPGQARTRARIPATIRVKQLTPSPLRQPAPSNQARRGLAFLRLLAPATVASRSQVRC
jgi:hypothetical protein